MSRVSRAVTLTVSLGIAILTGEAFIRCSVSPPWVYPRDPAEAALVQPHPIRSYALRANASRRWSREDFDVAVQVNERGLRDGPFADAGAAAFRVLAAGDSFTFGIGVEASETWAEQLESRLNEQQRRGPAAVLNTGVPGYSAKQIRQTIQEFAPELRPHVVIVGIYASSYWRVKNPYVLHGGELVSTSRRTAVEVMPDGSLLTTAFPPGRMRDLDLWLKRNFHIGARLLALLNRGRHWPREAPRRLYEASIREDYRPALEELSRLHAWSRERGWPLVVLAINQQSANGSFSEAEARYNEVLREFCSKEGIVYVDPLPHLSTAANGEPVFCRPGDLHWTPAAHGLAADLLLQRLDEIIPDTPGARS